MRILLADAAVDLVWCRDVLVHVGDLRRAHGESCRVLKPGGGVIVYQMFGGETLEPREAAWLWARSVVPSSADAGVTDAAIAGAGLRVDERVDVGPSGGWAQ